VLQNCAASPKLNKKATSSPVLAAVPFGLLRPLFALVQLPIWDKASCLTVKSRNLAPLLSELLNHELTLVRAVEVEYWAFDPKPVFTTVSLRTIKE